MTLGAGPKCVVLGPFPVPIQDDIFRTLFSKHSDQHKGWSVAPAFAFALSYQVNDRISAMSSRVAEKSATDHQTPTIPGP